jgi:hypothetical protein
MEYFEYLGGGAHDGTLDRIITNSEKTTLQTQNTDLCGIGREPHSILCFSPELPH